MQTVALYPTAAGSPAWSLGPYTPAPPTPLFLNSVRLGSKGVSHGPRGKITACLITCPWNTIIELNINIKNVFSYCTTQNLYKKSKIDL